MDERTLARSLFRPTALLEAANAALRPLETRREGLKPHPRLYQTPKSERAIANVRSETTRCSR